MPPAICSPLRRCAPRITQQQGLDGTGFPEPGLSSDRVIGLRTLRPELEL
jgi:hypothetical protein